MKLTNPMKDGVLGIAFLVAAAAILAGVAEYPRAAANFPRLIALGIFAIFGGLLVIRAIIQWRSDPAPTGPDSDDPASMPVQFDGRTIAMSAAICAAFFGVGYAGFIESMALLAIVSCLVFRIKIIAAFVYVALFCAILVGFLTLMGAQLPAGPLSGPLFQLLN